MRQRAYCHYKKKPSKQVARRGGEAISVDIRIPKRLKKYNVK